MPEDDVREMWSEDELDTALAALRSDVDTDDRMLARSRAELLVTAGTPAAEEPATVSANRSRRHWTWWAAAAATVVALVASLLVVQTGDQPVANAAAKKLNQAADQVGNTDEPMRPGQYRYIATHAWWMSTFVYDEGKYFSYLEERLIEEWVPADQRQEWLSRDTETGNRKWIHGSEEEAKAVGLDLAPRPPAERRAPCGDYYAADEGREPCTQEGAWQIPTEEFMASLPRDPNALYDRLRKDTEGRGKDPDLEMLVYAADMLRSSLVPADLRAALYRALGLVPGLMITEEVANLDGREGVAFGISAAGIRQDIIIDPATGQFIGERQISDEGYDGVPPGTGRSYTSVTTAVVDGMGVKPAG